MAFDRDVAAAIVGTAVAFGWPAKAFAAVVEVESGGKAFAKVGDNMLPLILFEPHVFYRCLPRAKRKEALNRNLARPKWGDLPYPKTQSARYNQLERAKTIDPEAAYKACSWGVGQVLGENSDWLGFPTARMLAEQAIASIEGQLDLMARFITKRGLVDELKARDWRGFARLYNGPGQVDYYAGRMAKAYARLGGKMPESSDLADDLVLRVGSSGLAVSQLQQNLRKLGFHLHIDGDFGPATMMAVRTFQDQQGLVADGIAGASTLGRIEAHLGRDVIALL